MLTINLNLNYFIINFIILDVTNVDRVLKYWCEWPLNRGKFVDSKECIEKWPRLVQTFLESKLGEVADNSSPIGSRVCEYTDSVYMKTMKH